MIKCYKNQASKTKITIVGSDQDMRYYSDTRPWHIDEMKVKVCEDNEHLGQIVSGIRQEQKNVDLRISKGRSNLFGMLIFNLWPSSIEKY